jgi:hypothetical protein
MRLYHWAVVVHVKNGLGSFLVGRSARFSISYYAMHTFCPFLPVLYRPNDEQSNISLLKCLSMYHKVARPEGAQPYE